MARTTTGRKKVAMEKIRNENALQVTFSKRRNGLFKKATELSVLCGSSLGIFLFSPGSRAYSFGSPDVPTIMRRFLLEGHVQQDGPVPDRGTLLHTLMVDLMKETDSYNQALRRRRDLTEASMLIDHQLEESKFTERELRGRIAKVQVLKALAEFEKQKLDHLVSKSQTSNSTFETRNLTAFLGQVASQQSAPNDLHASFLNEMLAMKSMTAYMGMQPNYLINPRDHIPGDRIMGFGPVEYTGGFPSILPMGLGGSGYGSMVRPPYPPGL